MKSNATVSIPKGLVHAGYHLSLRGERLKALLFSKIPLLGYVTGLDSVTITAEEWKTLFPDSENPYEDIWKAAKELMVCEVQLKGESKKYVFLNGVKCNDENERVILTPNWELLAKALFNDLQ